MRPMDLLLHLVSKNRIEIHDIPIHEITDQYLDYLNQAQVLIWSWEAVFYDGGDAASD